MSFFTLILIIIIINVFNRLLEGSQKQNKQEKSEQLNEGLEHLRQKQREPEQVSFETSIFDQFDDFFGDAKPVEEESSIEDQRQKQLENLAHRMDTSLDPEEDEEYSTVSIGTEKEAVKFTADKTGLKNEKMKKRIGNKLNKDGLIDSVIMAEVLGKPRSLRPYENVFMRK